MGEDLPVSFSLCAAFVVVVSAGILTNVYLFRLYRLKSDGEASGPRRGWTQSWEFPAASLGGFSYWQLALVSLLALFLELLLIRWISSEIRVFAYFKNFVLIACFLGFGLGCFLSRRKVNLLPLLAPLLALTLLVELPWRGLRDLMTDLPAFVGATSDMLLWSVPSLAHEWFSLVILAAAVVVIVPIFCLLTFVFIPLGQLVGWYLENAGNIVSGYSVNVLGSLAGILLYTLLCFLYQSPPTWFLLAAVMLVLLLWRLPRLRWGVAGVFAVCAALASLGPGNGGTAYWSPYQKLTLTPRQEGGQIVGYVLNTNNSWYQQILDLSSQFVASHPQLFKDEPVQWNPYNIPYHFYPQPPAVLVLGSGMGNDVAAALRNGAGRVVAVEIDPLILKLGREKHFERPYSSPRVREVLDDARSYVQNSTDRFDLIVFSLLDSHTTSSHFTNIRIDNYVYTLEALQASKRLLQPGGIFIIKFQVSSPWIAGRLRGLLETVFAHPPAQVRTVDADDGQLALLLPARAGIAGSGDPHLRCSRAALLAVPSPNRNGAPIHALAFLLPRCGLSPSRSANYQQDGPAVWDHLGRQLHRDCRASPADRGRKSPCGIQAGFPPWLGLRRNLRHHRGVLLGSAGKVSLPLHRVENVCGDTRPLPAGLFCWHRFRS